MMCAEGAMMFTTENAEEILAVIDGYERSLPGTGRRI